MEPIPKQKVKNSSFNGELDIELIIDNVNELIANSNNSKKQFVAFTNQINELKAIIETQKTEIATMKAKLDLIKI